MRWRAAGAQWFDPSARGVAWRCAVLVLALASAGTAAAPAVAQGKAGPGASGGAAASTDIAYAIAAAARAGTPFPDVDDAMSLPAAYVLQRRVIDAQLRAGLVVDGFKAGLTDAASWPRFGAEAPVAGVLFTAGRLTTGARVQRDGDDAPMIELELGYRVREAIASVPADDAALAAMLDAPLPVVELPNLAYASPPRLADIVGSNVAAARHIVGEPARRLAMADGDGLHVRLLRDGRVVAGGRGDAALGGQLAALRWLLATVLAQGHAIPAGSLLITGALAGMTPAEPGRYEADYGALGRIAFDVAATPAAGADAQRVAPQRSSDP